MAPEYTKNFKNLTETLFGRVLSDANVNLEYRFTLRNEIRM